MKFIEKIKKYLAITVILVILVGNVSPVFVYAEELAPTPTPEITQASTETPSPTDVPSVPTDTPVPTPTDVPLTQDPTPTPEETITPTPEQALTVQGIDENTNVSPTPTPGVDPTPGIGIDNSALVENNATSSATSGNNTIIATDSAELNNQEPNSNDQNSGNSSSQNSNNNGGSSVKTGDSISVANVENDINTTSINSEFINQTINIFVAEDGNLDLSNPSQLVSQIITAHPEEPVVNVSYVNIENFTYLTNDVVSTAQTGQNIVDGQKYAVIETGDAYSLVNVLNQVNLILVNSRVHILTINIFGDLGGNIILPDRQENSSNENCIDCVTSATIDNSAFLQNNLNSSADSGNNTIVMSDSGNITTGDAKSAINNINIVNKNLIGQTFQALHINNMGIWEGSFLGWGDGEEVDGYIREICLSCITSLDIENNAEVINNISSTAQTGSNSITGDNGEIRTGNAYSLISIFNFINTNIINSSGFFGFINIFGKWAGDIGGKSEFIVEEEVQENQENTKSASSQDNSPQQRSDKGLLTLTNSNNVGAFVYPGDTVTFSFKAGNPGEGMVYDTVIELMLVRDGEVVGGALFKTGNIDSKRAIKITTGLVLAKDTLPGKYTAVAIVRGYIGEDNREITARSDSFFLVRSKGYLVLSSNKTPEHVASVLGAQYPATLSNGAVKHSNFFLYLLIIDLFLFFDIKFFRERRKLMLIFAKESNLQTRLNVLRTFLF